MYLLQVDPVVISYRFKQDKTYLAGDICTVPLRWQSDAHVLLNSASMGVLRVAILLKGVCHEIFDLQFFS